MFWPAWASPSHVQAQHYSAFSHGGHLDYPGTKGTNMERERDSKSKKPKRREGPLASAVENLSPMLLTPLLCLPIEPIRIVVISDVHSCTWVWVWEANQKQGSKCEPNTDTEVRFSVATARDPSFHFRFFLLPSLSLHVASSTRVHLDRMLL